MSREKQQVERMCKFWSEVYKSHTVNKNRGTIEIVTEAGTIIEDYLDNERVRG